MKRRILILAGLLWISLIGVAAASHSADLNGDGKVDAADLTILKSQWGATGTADLNHNGVVNAQDAGILFSAWGTVPAPTCNTSTVGTNQLVGCLWDGTNFNTADGNAASGPTLASPVPTSATALDINWGTSGPNTTVGSDTFSARWKGTFTFPAGTYTFTGGSDDGMRVRLNGTTKIDQWVNRSYTENSFSQTFAAQTPVTLEIDFYEDTGDARVNFRWAGGSTGTRDPFLWPFTSESPLNMPIGSGAVYANITEPNWSGMWANLDSSTIAVYKASASDPLRTLTVTRYSVPNSDPDNPNFNQWVGPFTHTYQLRIPVGATYADYNPDHQVTILDPDGETLWEIYGGPNAAIDANGNWICQDLRKLKIKRDGYGKSPYGTVTFDGDPRSWHASTASGISVLGQTIRSGELANGTNGAGYIKRSLGVRVGGQVMNKNVSGGRGFIWPASNKDQPGDYTGTGNVYMGSLLAIPYSVNLNTLGLETPQGWVLARTAQYYGFYVSDGTHSPIIWIIEYKARPEVPAEGTSSGPVGTTPFSRDLYRIKNALKVVTNNGPNSIGGGGTPLQPLAPLFAP